MNIPITFILHWLLMLGAFGTGIGFFISSMLNQDFLIALIALTLPLIFINGYGVLTKSLSTKMLGYILSLYLFLISISVLSLYGFEPMAIGHETLYNFHLQGIASGVVLLLFSLVVLTMSLNRKEKPVSIPKIVKINLIPKQTKDVVVDSNDWEEATELDFQSGKYIV
tara:strand:+ start:21 stop:524 length:504 start_codon:yes stop_codon:yes gene_type:complete